MRIVLIISIIGFYQCTQPIANPITEPEKKLVISSFFTADEQLTVWVGYPHDILTDTLLFEANATVELFENEQFIENINYISDGHYQSNYILKTDQKYRIEVKTNELSASAEDVIPAKVLADSTFYEYVDLGNWDAIQKYRFQFQDISNEKNYYEFLFLKIYYPQMDLVDVNFVTFPRLMDPILNNENDYAFEPFTFFFSDELINGQRYEMNMEMEYSAWNDTIHDDLNLDFVIDNYENYLVFRTISKTYYDFQKSWAKHRSNQNIVTFYNNMPDVGMATFSEVQPLYTNIKNGYGIFVAYQEQIIPFEE
jgi:hypothetical protein